MTAKLQHFYYSTKKTEEFIVIPKLFNNFANTKTQNLT